MSESNQLDCIDQEVLCEGFEARPLPYQFEPLRGPTDNSVSSSPPCESDDDEVDRLNNTEWCTCGFCQQMPTHEESICCAECPKIWKKVLKHRSQLSENSQIDCITQVAGFEPVCLNPFVLETAYLQFKQEHTNLNTTQEEKYRYTAYRQLVRWCHGILGRSIRVPLPSCAVVRIRAEYPSEGNSYKGFQWPKL